MVTYRELIKQSLMEGLKRANYNIKHFKPAPIKAGLQGNRIWRINGKLWMMLFPFVLYRKPEEAVTTPEFPN